MALTNILNNLKKYKQVGPNKFRAPCPVHEGKDNNLIVSEDSAGKIGCHCFVCGANGLDVVSALGLSAAELFPPEDGYERPLVTQKMRDELAHDKVFMMMYEAAEQAGQYIPLSDKRRYKQAKARSESIEEKIQQSA